MLIMLVLQLAVPRLQILWLAIAAPSSRVWMAVHVWAGSAWLLTLGKIGLWTAPLTGHSMIAAMMLSSPLPQFGQCCTSTSNNRLSSSARHGQA